MKTNTWIKPLFVLACFLASSLVFSTVLVADEIPVIRVNKAQTSTPMDGTTWATAFSTVQAGIDAAAAYDEAVVWVAQGVYDEERHTAPQEINNTGAISLAKGIKLYGGFLGTENTLEERPADGRSVLDGSIARGGLPAYHVIMEDNANEDVYLDGFIVQGGDATSSNGQGGGLFTFSNTTLKNCTFQNNRAKQGGGVYVWSDYGAYKDIIVDNCTFVNNTATGATTVYGAGAYFWGNLSLSNSVFEGNQNTADNSYGAGMHHERGEQSIMTDCTFENNTSSATCYGAGAIIRISNDVEITRCVFTGNVGGGTGEGGGLNLDTSGTVENCIFTGNESNYGGGFFAYIFSDTFRNNTFSENYARTNGGAVYMGYSPGSPRVFSMMDCAFTNNTSENAGGAIAGSTDVLNLTRCLFQQNESTYGGAISVYDNTFTKASITIDKCQFLENQAGDESGEAGGALSISNVTLSVVNSVFGFNEAGNATALFLGKTNALLNNSTFINNAAGSQKCLLNLDNYSAVIASNSIFWGEGGFVAKDLTSSVEAAYCDIVGGLDGEGNFSGAPMLRDPENGDFTPMWESPCRDAGTTDSAPATDITGTSRPQGAGIDVGAEEFVYVDGDNDSMDDHWETVHGLNPEYAGDADEDADQDGWTNYEESQFYGDPQDDQNPPHPIYVAATGNDFSGSGHETAPWATITRAMKAAAVYSVSHPLSIVVGEGIFTEPVRFAPNVTLTGAGATLTKIQYYNEKDPEHVVVDAAQNTALQDCCITLSGFPATTTVLLRIDNVVMDVENVTLDGNDGLYTLGALVSDTGSSDSVIADCTFRRLHYGLQAVDSAVTVTRTNFTGIRGDAIFVRLPDTKSVGLTPLLGDAEATETTGNNRFQTVLGNYILNMSTSETKAENNDWGVYTEADIAKKMSGSIDFYPFKGAIAKGDVNGDGKTNYKDATWILQAAVGLRTLSDPLAGDVTGDGVANYKDASWILQAAVGLREL